MFTSKTTVCRSTSTISKEHLWISGKVGMSLLCHFSEVEGDGIKNHKEAAHKGRGGRAWPSQISSSRLIQG